eukprot:756558-Hanusia_phi.AAC.2
MQLEQADGTVNDLSFRTDFTSILASCSPSGAIHIWNLEKQQLVASLPQAHEGAVQTCRFLSGEPLLLTTGADNALKVSLPALPALPALLCLPLGMSDHARVLTLEQVWIFDQEDGSARLLRCRNGHCEPPSRFPTSLARSLFPLPLSWAFPRSSSLQPSHHPLCGLRPELPSLLHHPRPAEPRALPGGQQLGEFGLTSSSGSRGEEGEETGREGGAAEAAAGR